MHSLPTERTRSGSLPCYSAIYQKVAVARLQAEGDADVLIVKTAIDSAVTHPTVLVGDDTDPLVLLCYHTKAEGKDLYFRPEARAKLILL